MTVEKDKVDQVKDVTFNAVDLKATTVATAFPTCTPIMTEVSVGKTHPAHRRSKCFQGTNGMEAWRGTTSPMTPHMRIDSLSA